MIELYEYDGQLYPDYLKRGNAARFIAPVAAQFCVGRGIDVGCGKWPIEGAIPWDKSYYQEADALPNETFDYVFSSHCLEHVNDPIAVLEHWRSRLRTGGTLFLYLPHPQMRYWLPEHCAKHRHAWTPLRMVEIIEALGFERVLYSERDMAWSFAVVGFKA